MIQIKSIFLAAAACSLLCACANRQKSAGPSGGMITLSDADGRADEIQEPTQLWHATNERICVLFGYGYNSAEFVDSMTDFLGRNFGLEEDGGTILPLVFPDDFRRGTKTYITSLVDLLADKEVRGIILLGAPESTHVAIARIQDGWSDFPGLSFPVFSFFPQDDMLGMESAADFVLDKMQKADISGLVAEESPQNAASEIHEILAKSVKYMLMSGAPFEQNAKLYEIVKKLAEGKRILRYTDPDTGLISINHFVLE